MYKNFLEDFSNEDILFDEEIVIEDNIYTSPPKKKKNIKKSKKKSKNKTFDESFLNINVDYDENKEKVLVLSLEFPVNENSDEKIYLDMNINKTLFLLLGEELFS